MLVFIGAGLQTSPVVILILVWAQYFRTTLLAKCAERAGFIRTHSSKYVAVHVSIHNTALK